MSLRKRTFSAVRWTTAGSISKAFLQIIQLAILARILSPSDYGLMALVLIVMGFAALFSDFGLNSAFVQRRNVTEEQRSSLYWLNVSISFGLMLLVITVSPLLAWFFDNSELIPLVILSSTSFVFAALGIQVRMAAEKELRFRPVMIVEVIASIIGMLSAVLAAFYGWGVYSLVVGMLVSTIATTIMLWMYVSSGWRPMFRMKLDDIKSFLGFGGALVANNIINHFNLTIDLLLGGRMLAASQLGLYSVPKELVLRLQSVVNPIITRVAFPLISEVQNDVKKVRLIYLQTVNMTASTNAPIYIGIAFFAPEFVSILLGDGWEGSIQLLQILAVWGALKSTGNPVGSLLLGMGRADLSLKWNLSLLFIVPPVIFYGSKFGAVGLAWALLLMTIILFVPGWYVLIRPLCHAKLLEYSIAVLRPFALSVIAVFPAYLYANNFHNEIARMLIGLIIAAPLYMALSYLANKRWIDAMRELVFKKPSTI